jgi:hypothetical protein
VAVAVAAAVTYLNHDYSTTTLIATLIAVESVSYKLRTDASDRRRRAFLNKSPEVCNSGAGQEPIKRRLVTSCPGTL